MDDSSYFRFDDDNKTKQYIFSIIMRELGKLKTYSHIYWIMDNWENMLNLTHTLDKIYLADISSSMFTDNFATMMIMGWCNVQINEYDLQAITYLTICTHQKLHNNDENKVPVFFLNVYAIRDRIWYNKHLRHTTTEKYDNNGKGWYFRFDDDNNMSYK